MKGKKICLYLLLAGCLLSTAVVGRAEDEAGSGISTSLDLSYFTKYVWRGITFTNGSVFQPSLTFAHPSGASLNIWGNMDLSNANDSSGEFNEIDYTLDYSWATGPLAMSAGAIYYDFPNTGAEPTAEVYLGAGIDGPLAPSLTVYYDFKEIDGFYARLGVFHSLPIRLREDQDMSLDLGASVGFGSSDFNNGYFGVDKSAFSDLLVSAAVPIPIKDNITITPSVYYSTIINSDLGDALEAGGTDKSVFFAGVTASFAF